MRQVAEDLGVKYLVEGSVRRAGGKLRINAKLIDVVSGRYLWAESYDGSSADTADIFALQDKVVGDVAGSLLKTLKPSDVAREADAETPSIAAYDAFTEGWQYYRERTPESLAKAVKLFKKALELDSDYARASAALAEAYAIAYENVWESHIGESIVDARYKQFALREAALKKPSPFVNRVAAIISLGNHENDQALQYAQRALELDANDPDGHLAMAQVLIFSDRAKEGIAQIEQAIRLNPNERHTYSRLLGRAYWVLKEYEKASDLLDPWLAAHPTDWLSAMYLAVARTQLGQINAAAAAYEQFFTGFESQTGWPPGILNWGLWRLRQRHPSTWHVIQQDPELDFSHGLTSAALAHTIKQNRIALETRLSGDQITRLLFDQTQVMQEPQTLSETEFRYDDSGRFSMSGFWGNFDGVAELDNDRLCLDIEKPFVGLVCGYVLPDSSGSASGNTYTFVSSDGVLPFTVWQYALPDKPSIAVLPFANMSGDESQEYFVDGMTDTLITDLSNIPELFVIARNTSFTYKGQAVDVKAVGRELGVKYILEGSVQRAGGRVRINAQLIDATTGGHIWSERFDRANDDIFALQDEAIAKIIAALPIVPAAAELTEVPTESLEAYDLYLRGMETIDKLNLEELQSSIEFFEKALEIDSDFGLAHRARVLATTQIFIWGLDLERWDFITYGDDTPWFNAELAINEAKIQNDELAIAHAMKARVEAISGAEYGTALKSAKLAIEIDPTDPDVLATYAAILSYEGEHERALTVMEDAYRLNPKPPPYYFLDMAMIQFHLERFGEAIENAQIFQSKVPDSYFASWILAPALAYLGRPDEARAELDILLKRRPEISLELLDQATSSQSKDGKFIELAPMPMRMRKDRGRRVEGLRLAGAPIYESGAEPRGERLTQEEIEVLLEGQTITGQDFAKGSQWWRRQEADGSARHWDNIGGEMSGTFTIEDGWACWEWDVADDFKRCNRVYRNTKGRVQWMNQYLMAGTGCICAFRIEEKVGE